MEGMTSLKTLRVDVLSLSASGIAGLSLVGYDSPVSPSFESAHFSPFLPLPQERLNFSHLFCLHFFRFYGLW